MPTPEQFKNGFGLSSGMYISTNLKLLKCTIIEKPIIVYKEYSYNIELEFEYYYFENINTLIDTVNKVIKDKTPRFIKTKYGNTYKCIFNSKNIIYTLEGSNKFILYYVGHAERI